MVDYHVKDNPIKKIMDLDMASGEEEATCILKKWG